MRGHLQNLGTRQGEVIPQLREQSLEVISLSLLLSIEGQESFAASGACLVIAHLLGSSRTNLTFSVYSRLYTLYTSVGCESLRNQLFELVMDPKLWLHERRVVRDWTQKLLGSVADIEIRRPFVWFLGAVASYAVGPAQKEARLALLEMAFALHHSTVSGTDVKALVAHILTAEEACDTLDLLAFLRRFLPLPEFAERVGEAGGALAALHFLLGKGGSIARVACETIVEAHRVGAVSGLDLIEHADIILHQLIDTNVTSSFLESMPEVPEFLPLRMWTALALGREALEGFVSDLAPADTQGAGEFWAIWPAVAYFRAPRGVREGLAKILASAPSPRGTWTTLEIVRRALGAEVDLLVSFLEQLREIGAPEFVEIAKHFILFGERPSHSLALEAAFARSPYAFVAVPAAVARPARRSRRNRYSLKKDLVPPPPTADSRYSPALTETALSILQTSSGPRASGAAPVPRRSSIYRVKVDAPRGIRPSMEAPLELGLSAAAFDGRIAALAGREWLDDFRLRLDARMCWLDIELAEHIAPQVELVRRYLDPHGTGRGRLEDREFGVAARQLLKRIIQFQGRSNQRALELFALATDTLRPLSATLVCDFSEAAAVRTTCCSKAWSRLWHQLALPDAAPWHRALTPGAIREVHFKRDRVLCGAGVPAKLKRNPKHDQHTAASIMREIGDKRDAIALAEHAKTELEERYADERLQLFEIDEDEGERDQGVGAGASCLLDLPCEFITVCGPTPGNFSVTRESLVFSRSDKTRVLPLNQVRDVLLRTRCHRPTAVEIFTTSGRAYFVNFGDVLALPVLRALRGVRMPALRTLQTEPFKAAFTASGATRDWVDGRISTFEYILRLNSGSGRTFNDVTQYPIFPWVLSDYTSATLDLTAQASFRVLAKPMGAQDADRLQQLMSKARVLSEMGEPFYLYSSGYSCPLSVYLWLLRVEPFTTLHIEMQSGKLDHASRQFSSIPSAWRLTTTNVNDYRELLPEFFADETFLENREGFDLGCVDGRSISEVKLPPWAASPIEFVYLNRKALESPIASSGLPAWIDLVWGERSRGEKARASDNVFQPLMYDVYREGMAAHERAEADGTQLNVGQIPPQLFDRPHPARAVRSATQRGIARVNSARVKQPRWAGVEIDANYVTVTTIAAAGAGTVARHAVAKLFTRGDPQVETIQREFLAFDECTRALIGPYLLGQPGDLWSVRLAQGAVELVQRRSAAILAASCDGEWLATANDDARVLVLEGGRLRVEIPTFTSRIVAVGLSVRWQLLVLAAAEGLFLYNLAGNFVRMVQCTRRPVAVLVTGGWGFILVYGVCNEGRHWLQLLTVNGDFVREVELSATVGFWTSTTSRDGFDFVSLSFDNGEFFRFEAFWLDLGAPRYSAGEPVLLIQRCEDLAFDLIVTWGGRIVFVSD
jgi:hypothetical protein